jgi:opacity protein-like surface antigen
MKKMLLVFGAILLFAFTALAQDDDYPKFELAGMGSMLVADIDILGDETMWGYGIGAQYNINKAIGIVGEWGANHGESEFDGVKLDTRVQTLLFGPRFSYRTNPVTVFGHVLIGAGTTKLDDDIGTFDFGSYTSWQVAVAIGGGLDINVGKSFAIRPVQFDYLYLDSDINSLSDSGPGSLNNYRYMFGAVFKF